MLRLQRRVVCLAFLLGGVVISLFRVGGVAFFLFLCVVLFRELAFASSWGLTIFCKAKDVGKSEPRASVIVGSWSVVFFCYWCFLRCSLGFGDLALSLTFAISPPSGWYCFPSGSLVWCCLPPRPLEWYWFLLPLFWGGAALVGVAVPSSFGVVLLAPLGWCCFLSLSALWPCCFGWCCFLLLGVLLRPSPAAWKCCLPPPMRGAAFLGFLGVVPPFFFLT